MSGTKFSSRSLLLRVLVLAVICCSSKTVCFAQSWTTVTPTWTYESFVPHPAKQYVIEPSAGYNQVFASSQYNSDNVKVEIYGHISHKFQWNGSLLSSPMTIDMKGTAQYGIQLKGMILPFGFATSKFGTHDLNGAVYSQNFSDPTIGFYQFTVELGAVAGANSAFGNAFETTTKR